MNDPHLKILNSYIRHILHSFMVKTLRIVDENLHKELLKIQGELQAKSGEFTSMDDTIATLVEAYRKTHRK